MTAIILTAHTLLVLGLIIVVLLQRSDGGALGIGGGGGGGGFMTGRGAANALTRTTSVLAALFFATSLGLAMLAGGGESAESVIEGLTGEEAPAPSDGAISSDAVLDAIGAGEGAGEGAGNEAGDAERDAGPDARPDAASGEPDPLEGLGAEDERNGETNGADGDAPN